MCFFWDPNAKGSGIKLNGSNLVATKTPESQEYHTVLGNLPMSSGKNYWEIKIDNYQEEDDIFIGIARKEMELTQ